MELNETVETTETPVEETQEPVSEEVDDVADDVPTLEDYEKLKKEKETILAQKEHWRKKAEGNLKAARADKDDSPHNSDIPSVSKEDAIAYAKLYSRGLTDEEVETAVKIAGYNKITPLEAVEDPYLKSKIKERQRKERSEQAALAPSGTSQFQNKNFGEMTAEEHKKEWFKALGV